MFILLRTRHNPVFYTKEHTDKCVLFGKQIYIEMEQLLLRGAVCFISKYF